MADETLQEIFSDSKQALEKRLAAGKSLVASFQGIREDYALFSAFCKVYMDERDDASIRIIAVNGIEKAPSVNHLVRVVRNEQVRTEAIAALKRIGPSKLTASLNQQIDIIQKQMDSGKWDVNGYCAISNLPLGHGRDPAAMNMLHKCLNETTAEAKAAAVRSLAMLGEIDVLSEALKDPDEKVRSTAAEFCGYFDSAAFNEESLDALNGLLQDPSEQVQKSARTALKKLGLLSKAKPKAKVSSSKSKTKSAKYDWQELMKKASKHCLANEDYAAELPDEVVENGWLGFDGASAKDLADLEKRLGMSLPPSYREFLQLSNGWRRVNESIDNLWSANEVDFFRARNQQWIDAYCKILSDDLSPEQHLVYGDKQDCCNFRRAYLKTAIEISDVGDSAILLLNPEVVNSEGEWEAWFFANWNPGANRYESFWKLLETLTKK